MKQTVASLERDSLAKNIVGELRRKIITGELEDGAFLREVEISNEMNTSRGPVRSAIQQLVADGLAVPLENGRTQVVSIEEKDIEDIYALRLTLEKQAAHLLSSQPVEQFMPLMQNLNAMKEEMGKGVSADNRAMAELGYDIHVTIMKISGNKAVFNAWKSVSAVLRTIMELNSDAVNADYVYESHKQLVEGILHNDPQMDEIIKQHLYEDSRDIFMKIRQMKERQDA